MNRDDIIRMAQEAGAFFDGDCSVYDMPEHCFEKFAALVAAAERDRATKICEYAMQMYKDNQNLSPDQSKVGFLSAEFCAAHIKFGESWS